MTVDTLSDEKLARNSHGQPVSCAPVWVVDASERHGGHWTAECPNLIETNPTDMK